MTTSQTGLGVRKVGCLTLPFGDREILRIRVKVGCVITYEKFSCQNNEGNYARNRTSGGVQNFGTPTMSIRSYFSSLTKACGGCKNQRNLLELLPFEIEFVRFMVRDFVYFSGLSRDFLGF